MRYVRIEKLRPGMILGKTILASHCYSLLSKNTVLTAEYITRIKNLGFSGVYITDEFSENINIPEIISEKLKMEALIHIKNFFNNITPHNTKREYRSIKKSIIDIVDDILTNKDVMLSINDLKNYDNYTYFHSVNVSILSLVIGSSFDLTKESLYELGLAGILHDIGKELIPIEILNKKGRLTDEEFDIIKQHPKKGYELIKSNFSHSARINQGILHHHERYDGSGYPSKLKGDKINLYSRIIAIADVFDALVSNRPYHKAFLPSDAIELIMSGSGTSFDPIIVEHFINHVAIYPVGTEIELSNGKKALVMENYQGYPTRPKIKLLDTGEEISLKNNWNFLSLTIVGVG